MNVLDLFSGIGGFSLGLERAGMKTIAFCEINPFCRKILTKHWPQIPIFEDIRTLKGKDIGPVDVICGGYPCQPFSVAGGRRGKKDDRYLWPEMFRLIKELRPSWVIGENVNGHINMGFDTVLSDLEAANYTTRAFVIPAVAVDAKHRRDRLWIIANSDSQRRGAEQKRELRSSDSPIAWNDGEKQLMADTDSQRELQQARFEQKFRFRASERCRWEPESRICRVVNGLPNRVDRIKALGNSVVPQIVQILGSCILEIDKND